MTGVTIETVHAALVGLHEDLVGLRGDIWRLEVKIDGMPSLATMWIGVFVLVFGMAGVAAATVAILYTLGSPLRTSSAGSSASTRRLRGRCRGGRQA